MPTVINRGCRVNYEVVGSGTPVVLQHGFLWSEAAWRIAGHVDALSDQYRVINVESLAHGKSSSPADPAAYGLEQRASDLIAVLDDLGEERAHFVGYSMGGWMVGGVATHFADRATSITVGGFDIVDGPESFNEDIRNQTGIEDEYDC